MAKKEDFNIVKTTKLNGEFVKAGTVESFDPSTKGTKDLIERGIISKVGEVTITLDPNLELKAENETLKSKVSELEAKIEELEAKEL